MNSEDGDSDVSVEKETTGESTKVQESKCLWCGLIIFVRTDFPMSTVPYTV